MDFWRKLSIRIWYLWHFRAIFSYLVQMLKGYFPWQRTYSKHWTVSQLTQYIGDEIEWKEDQVDYVRHPLQTLKEKKVDCEDFAALWLSFGEKTGLTLKPGTIIHPLGLLTSLWKMPDGTREGHCAAIYINRKTRRLWLFDNKILRDPDIYLTREFQGSIYRHLAKYIAPGDAIVVFCDVVKPNLFSRIHWSF